MTPAQFLVDWFLPIMTMIVGTVGTLVVLWALVRFIRGRTLDEWMPGMDDPEGLSHGRSS
jgi:hypothetical protein